MGKRKKNLTGVGGSEEGGVVKIAVKIMAASGLKVSVHGVRCM